MNKCVMCGNKNTKKITINIKIKHGYKSIDEIYLCENCLEITKNNTDIIWYYLWKNKIKGDIDG